MRGGGLRAMTSGGKAYESLEDEVEEKEEEENDVLLYSLPSNTVRWFSDTRETSESIKRVHVCARTKETR